MSQNDAIEIEFVNQKEEKLRCGVLPDTRAHEIIAALVDQGFLVKNPPGQGKYLLHLQRARHVLGTDETAEAAGLRAGDSVEVLCIQKAAGG